MRFPILALLTLISFSTISAQPREVVQDKGNFGLHVVNDSIHQYKYLERENQLLLIGWENVQLIDLNNFKVVATRPFKMPISDIRPEYQHEDWPISPDGRFLLLCQQSVCKDLRLAHGRTLADRRALADPRRSKRQAADDTRGHSGIGRLDQRRPRALRV